MTRRVASLILALALCPQAGALSLIDDDANLVEVTGPQDFSDDGPLQSNTEIYFFQERDDYTLPSDVTINARAPGTYSTAGPSQVLSMGQVVDIFFIHMDVVSGTVVHGGGGSTAASIVFDEMILGVIGIATDLDASDSLGDPFTIYLPVPAARQIWESEDILTISADRRTLTLDSLRVGSATTYADQIRVIVATPEPGTAALMASGLAVLAASRRRAYP
jgi:hypothetical protein